MTEKELMLAINQIDDTYIMEAEETDRAEGSAWRLTLPGTMAACLLLGFVIMLFGIPLIRKAMSGSKQPADPVDHTGILSRETEEGERKVQDTTEMVPESTEAYLLDLSTICMVEVTSNYMGCSLPTVENAEKNNLEALTIGQSQELVEQEKESESETGSSVTSNLIGTVYVNFWLIRGGQDIMEGTADAQDRYIARFEWEGEEREISRDDLTANEFVCLVAQEILGTEDIDVVGELQIIFESDAGPQPWQSVEPLDQEPEQDSTVEPEKESGQNSPTEPETEGEEEARQPGENGAERRGDEQTAGYSAEICYSVDSLPYITELQDRISAAMMNGELPFVCVSAVRENPYYLDIQVLEGTSQEEIAKILAYDPTGKAIQIRYSSGFVKQEQKPETENRE